MSKVVILVLLIILLVGMGIYSINKPYKYNNQIVSERTISVWHNFNDEELYENEDIDSGEIEKHEDNNLDSKI